MAKPAPSLELEPWTDDNALKKVMDVPRVGRVRIDVWKSKPQPFNDGWLEFPRPDGGMHLEIVIGLHSYNYFARLLQYLAPISQYFETHHRRILHGLDDVREWIFEKYVEASYANRHPIHPDYSATIEVPGMNLDGGHQIEDYKLRVDQRVVNPIVVSRPIRNHQYFVEVQFPVAFYNKVRYFVKTYFPDVEEGKVIRAIAILFNNSVNFLKLGWDNPRDKFIQMYGKVEGRNESFPRIDIFPYNWK